MFGRKNRKQEELTEEEYVNALAIDASMYAGHGAAGSINESTARTVAINSDIASWHLANASLETMMLSRKAAGFPMKSIIPYGSSSYTSQNTTIGILPGLAIGFVLLVALLGLLSMMGIIPKPGVPTQPIEPPGNGWILEQIPCPPNVEPGTVIMESRTKDYPPDPE